MHNVKIPAVADNKEKEEKEEAQMTGGERRPNIISDPRNSVFPLRLPGQTEKPTAMAERWLERSKTEPLKLASVNSDTKTLAKGPATARYGYKSHRGELYHFNNLPYRLLDLLRL